MLTALSLYYPDAQVSAMAYIQSSSEDDSITIQGQGAGLQGQLWTFEAARGKAKWCHDQCAHKASEATAMWHTLASN